MFKSFYFLLVFLFLLFNCTESTPTQDKSEMASLMRKMVDTHEQVRTNIKSGKPIGDLPDYYMDIFDAKFTDESQNHEDFEAFAKAYIQAERTLYNSKTKEEQIANYKSAINSCIQCHSSISCNGPIAKIKTLYYSKD